MTTFSDHEAAQHAIALFVAGSRGDEQLVKELVAVVELGGVAELRFALAALATVAGYFVQGFITDEDEREAYVARIPIDFALLEEK